MACYRVSTAKEEPENKKHEIKKWEKLEKYSLFTAFLLFRRYSSWWMGHVAARFEKLLNNSLRVNYDFCRSLTISLVPLF